MQVSQLSDIRPIQVKISLTKMRHYSRTCARGAVVRTKLKRHIAVSIYCSLAQSLKGTAIKLSVVETHLFCVEFSKLSFVTPEMWAFPVWLTIFHSVW